jgi:hypothetical protein
MPYTYIAHTNIKMLRMDQVKHNKKIAPINKALTKLSIDRFADIGMNDLGATLQEGDFYNKSPIHNGKRSTRPRSTHRLSLPKRNKLKRIKKWPMQDLHGLHTCRLLPMVCGSLCIYHLGMELQYISVMENFFYSAQT